MLQQPPNRNRRRIAQGAWILVACLAIGKAITSNDDKDAQLLYVTVAAVLALVWWASVRWPRLGR